MAQPTFRSIGHYEITRDDDVIRVWSSHEFNLEAIDVARVQWERVYDGLGVAFRFFAEPEPARPWLQEQIDRARA